MIKGENNVNSSIYKENNNKLSVFSYSVTKTKMLYLINSAFVCKTKYKSVFFYYQINSFFTIKLKNTKKNTCMVISKNVSNHKNVYE